MDNPTAMRAYRLAESDAVDDGWPTAKRLLEGAARLVHTDPDRARIVSYHVAAWIRLWPDGPGREQALRRAEAARFAVEEAARTGGEAQAKAAEARLRDLLGWLRTARSAAGAEEAY
jgi:hypothetical protein